MHSDASSTRSELYSIMGAYSRGLSICGYILLINMDRMSESSPFQSHSKASLDGGQTISLVKNLNWWQPLSNMFIGWDHEK